MHVLKDQQEGCHVYNLAMFLVYRATLLSFSSDVISIKKVVREIRSHFYLTNCNYLPWWDPHMDRQRTHLSIITPGLHSKTTCDPLQVI